MEKKLSDLSFGFQKEKSTRRSSFSREHMKICLLKVLIYAFIALLTEKEYQRTFFYKKKILNVLCLCLKIIFPNFFWKSNDDGHTTETVTNLDDILQNSILTHIHTHSLYISKNDAWLLRRRMKKLNIFYSILSITWTRNSMTFHSNAAMSSL